MNFDIPIFLSNAAAAFGLNMSVFLLIGKTSALTMNIAGVIKDWMLIGLSVAIFKAVWALTKVADNMQSLQGLSYIQEEL